MITALSSFIQNQVSYLLKNKWHALIHAIGFALLPFTTWLAASILALVTLRKGIQAGLWLLGPVLTAHFALSLISHSVIMSGLNTLLTFMPCFVAACSLRLFVSWRSVFWVLLAGCALGIGSVQWLNPDFITTQYQFFQEALKTLQPESPFIALMSSEGVSQVILAYYFQGLQAAGLLLSACLSLMLARMWQSRLFYPGEFEQEMLNFRADKVGLLLLLLIGVGAYQHQLLAIGLLPAIALYFMFAGLSLICKALLKKRPFGTVALVVSTLLIIPFIMLPVYVILGVLDTVFNFRVYLPTNAGKTIRG